MEFILCVTAGGPKAHHPAPMQRLEERCRNRGCFIAQSSTARPSGASVGAATPSWTEHCRPGRPSDSRCRVDAQICSARRYSALYKLGVVRDHARAALIAENYPDGLMPDGRRIVHIGLAA
jgi:hypothetical protein